MGQPRASRRRLALCLICCAVMLPAGCLASLVAPISLSRAGQQPASSVQQQQQSQQSLRSRFAAQQAQHVASGWSSLQQQDQQHQQPAQQQPTQQQQQHKAPERAAQGSRRALRQYKPSARDRDDAHHRQSSLLGWHAAGVALLSVAGMAALSFIAHKAMQWLERARRPGYVELQSLDAAAFHRPTFTL